MAGASLSLLVAAALLLSAGCAGAPGPSSPRPVGEPTVTIHVVGHGWHTGIVVARADIPAPGWPEAQLFPPARFLEVGWGDRAFYQAADPGIGLALAAAFESKDAVLHVIGLDRAPDPTTPGAEVVAIEVPAGGMEGLARYLSDAYARDAEGRPVDLGPGLAALSRFYAATGRYSLFHNCNNWAAEALAAAGCPTTPGWAVTAENLLAQARSCAERARPRPRRARPRC